MTRTAGAHMLALLTLLALAPAVAAQNRNTDLPALKADIEQRFELLPLRDGFVLRPRDTSRGVRSVEISRGPVAVDGQPATGAELREKLGADADLILRLSYLTDDERLAFLGGGVAPPPTGLSDQPSRAERRDAERAARRSRTRGNGDDRVRIGGGVTVRAGEVVPGNVVAIGGGVDVDGEVHGDVVAIGGSVRLGPAASVANNVVVVGGTLQRDPGARIDGQVQEIGMGAFDLSRVRWPAVPAGAYWGTMFGSTFALVGTLSRLAILCLLCALVVLIGRRYAARAGDFAVVTPLKSGAIGFLAQLLFLPVLVITIVVLCITIVGIPLLLLIPFVILALAVVGLVGFTGVALRVGDGVADRFGMARDNIYLATVIGVVLLLSPAVLARLVGVVAGGWMFPVTLALGILGGVVEYLAWTVGFGAVVLARLEQRGSAPTLTMTPAASEGA